MPLRHDTATADKLVGLDLEQVRWSMRKRVYNEADSTSAGTASSIAAMMVQRPSPESSTNPEKFDRLGFSASAMAVRSSNHKLTTLPRRYTSAMSATFRS
jgi:hypothetical protein